MSSFTDRCIIPSKKLAAKRQPEGGACVSVKRGRHRRRTTFSVVCIQRSDGVRTRDGRREAPATSPEIAEVVNSVRKELRHDDVAAILEQRQDV
jgi:hypothetical protein